MMNKLSGYPDVSPTSRPMTIVESLDIDIDRAEKKLAELKELKALLDSDPKMKRLLDLVQQRGMY